MVLLEIARSPSGALPAFAREAIANHFAIFLDDRDDKSGVVVTHIYLLLGCAIPVWLEVFCRSPTDDRALSTFRAATGILLIGICDGAAAVVGSTFGTIRWPYRKHTFLGSASFFLTFLIGVFVVSPDLYAQPVVVVKIIISLSLSTVFEVYTNSVDNLLLPMYFLTIFNSLPDHFPSLSSLPKFEL